MSGMTLPAIHHRDEDHLGDLSDSFDQKPHGFSRHCMHLLPTIQHRNYTPTIRAITTSIAATAKMRAILSHIEITSFQTPERKYTYSSISRPMVWLSMSSPSFKNTGNEIHLLLDQLTNGLVVHRNHLPYRINRGFIPPEACGACRPACRNPHRPARCRR